MKEAEKGREDWSSLVVASRGEGKESRKEQISSGLVAAENGSVTFQSPRGDGNERAFDRDIIGVVRKRLKGHGTQ